MELGTSSVQEIVFGKCRVSDGVIPIWPIQVKLETGRRYLIIRHLIVSVIVSLSARYFFSARGLHWYVWNLAARRQLVVVCMSGRARSLLQILG